MKEVAMVNIVISNVQHFYEKGFGGGGGMWVIANSTDKVSDN